MPSNIFRNLLLSSVVVNEQGILCGVNVPAVSVKNCETKANILTKNAKQLSTQDLLPLTQDYMMAGSTAKMAEGAAKQIYTIRESRLNLLTGEVDHMPDGEAMRIMSELTAKEKSWPTLYRIRTRKFIHILNSFPEDMMSEGCSSDYRQKEVLLPKKT